MWLSQCIQKFLVTNRCVGRGGWIFEILSHADRLAFAYKKWAIRFHMCVPETMDEFELFSWIFAVFLATELIILLTTDRGWLFSGPDAFWNLFDFVLVAGFYTQSIQDKASWILLRVMRAFHAVRMVRVIRVYTSSEICDG